jgi:glycerol kinase
MPHLVMAIDAGTTGITVLVIDDRAKVHGRAYSELSQSYPHPGWVEHDPGEMWQMAVAMMHRALEDAQAQATEVAAIGIANQRETTVLWERATGQPSGPRSCGRTGAPRRCASASGPRASKRSCT